MQVNAMALHLHYRINKYFKYIYLEVFSKKKDKCTKLESLAQNSYSNGCVVIIYSDFSYKNASTVYGYEKFMVKENIAFLKLS